MGNYATVVDVKALKFNCAVVDLDGCTDPEIDAEIDLAEETVETITNDRFNSFAETNTFDGTGFTRLFFFPRIPYPLVSVVKVEELDTDGVTVLEVFVEDEDFKRYPQHLETAFMLDEDTPRRRFGTGGVWPKGQNNIRVQGTWGRSAVPEAIKRAVILLVLERMRPGSTGASPADVTRSKWPDFEIEFRAAEEVGQSTGFAVVDRLLEGHINYVDMFQFVPFSRQTFEGRE